MHKLWKTLIASSSPMAAVRGDSFIRFFYVEMSAGLTWNLKSFFISGLAGKGIANGVG